MRAMLADRSRSALADPHRFPYSPICRSASIPRLPTSMRPVYANSRRRIRIRTSGSPPSRPRPTARTHLSGSNPSPRPEPDCAASTPSWLVSSSHRPGPNRAAVNPRGFARAVDGLIPVGRRAQARGPSRTQVVRRALRGEPDPADRL